SAFQITKSRWRRWTRATSFYKIIAMQKGLVIAALCALSLGLAVGAFSQDRGGKAGVPKGGPPMALTSPAFAHGTDIPPKYTQAAGDQVISPTLEWTNAPAGTQTSCC